MNLLKHPFKFRDNTAKILLAFKSADTIPAKCPFCNSKIDMRSVEMEANALESVRYDFSYKCTNCGIRGMISVEYNIESLTPIGGRIQILK